MVVRKCRQEAVALSLATGRTVRDAATATRVAERTIRHWLTLPSFRERIAELRTELFGQAVGRLAELAGIACQTLQGLLQSDSENIRLGASRTILEHAPKLREATELAGELNRLKRELGSRPIKVGGAKDLTDQDLDDEIAALRERISKAEAADEDTNEAAATGCPKQAKNPAANDS